MDVLNDKLDERWAEKDLSIFTTKHKLETQVKELLQRLQKTSGVEKIPAVKNPIRPSTVMSVGQLGTIQAQAEFSMSYMQQKGKLISAINKLIQEMVNSESDFKEKSMKI